MMGADNHQRGIIPRMTQHVFEKIAQANSDIQFTIKVSMVEVYMEKVQDLIDRSKTDLKIKDGGTIE